MNRGVIGFIVLVLILTVVSAGVGVYLYDRAEKRRRMDEMSKDALERVRKQADEARKRMKEHQDD